MPACIKTEIAGCCDDGHYFLTKRKRYGIWTGHKSYASLLQTQQQQDIANLDLSVVQASVALYPTS